MIDAVLPQKLTRLHAAQCVDGCGVGSTMVLDLNQKSSTPERDLLYIAPAASDSTQQETLLRWIICTYVHM